MGLKQVRGREVWTMEWFTGPGCCCHTDPCPPPFACLQPGGGVLSPQVAAAALTSMAERGGALVRGRLVLTGEKRGKQEAKGGTIHTCVMLSRLA